MNRHFIRHYLEMLAAMFAGMLVLWMPVEMAFPDVAPAVTFLGMATTMTVPMVAWMRRRGHGWQPSVEMAAAMFIPTFAAITLHGAGALDFDSLMMLEHVAMLLAMLAAMLLRPAEYAGHAAREPAA